jgi:hypothetical protein
MSASRAYDSTGKRAWHWTKEGICVQNFLLCLVCGRAVGLFKHANVEGCARQRSVLEAER